MKTSPARSVHARPGRRRVATLVSTVVLALTAGSLAAAPGAAAADGDNAPGVVPVAQADICIIPGVCIPVPEVPGLPIPDLDLGDLLGDLGLGLEDLEGLGLNPDDLSGIGLEDLLALLESLGIPLPGLPGTEDTTPPDTTITSGLAQGATTDDTTPSFGFSGTDGDVASFECNVETSNYFACTSPIKLPKLPDGTYTFRVRAIDEAGNTDESPATRTFTVKAADTESGYSPECIAAATKFLDARDKANRAAKQVGKAKKLLGAKKASKPKTKFKKQVKKKKVNQLKRKLRQKRTNSTAAKLARNAALTEARKQCQV